MSSWPAYEEFTLAHGSTVVRLRPSLRAISTLERKHGFAKLFRLIDEFDTRAIAEVIRIAATDTRDASDFLAKMRDAPLKDFFAAAHSPVVALCRSFIPSAEGRAPASAKPSTRDNSKPGTPWNTRFLELFKIATGWLHWTPEAAWNATQNEITDAYAGAIAMLKAVHGSGDETETIDPEQAAQNEAEGLDPEFDRAALRALKMSL